MNVNEKILTLREATGYPVEQDCYEGKEEKYIVFVYEDESTALEADNVAQASTAYLRVTLFTPKDWNYFADKKKIRKALLAQEFNITSISSWLQDVKIGTERIRRTDFEVNITEAEQ